MNIWPLREWRYAAGWERRYWGALVVRYGVPRWLTGSKYRPAFDGWANGRYTTRDVAEMFGVTSAAARHSMQRIGWQMVRLRRAHKAHGQLRASSLDWIGLRVAGDLLEVLK